MTDLYLGVRETSPNLKRGDRVYYAGDTDGHLPARHLTGTVMGDDEGLYVSWDNWGQRQRWHINTDGGGLSQPQRTCFRVALVKESRS